MRNFLFSKQSAFDFPSNYCSVVDLRFSLQWAGQRGCSSQDWTRPRVSLKTLWGQGFISSLVKHRTFCICGFSSIVPCSCGSFVSVILVKEARRTICGGKIHDRWHLPLLPPGVLWSRKLGFGPSCIVTQTWWLARSAILKDCDRGPG